MSDNRNFLDDNAFKPLAKIEGGKTMRLRVQLWNNCIQLCTKVGGEFLNMDLSLEQFDMATQFSEEIQSDWRGRNVAITLRRGKDNQQYGLCVFGVGEDGIWYIGAKDTRGNVVKHTFTPSVKYTWTADGKAAEDSDVSFRMFRAWFRNINRMLPVVWRAAFKDSKEREWKPNGGQGGQGGGYNRGNNQGGGYNQNGGGRPAPQLDFDSDIAF